MFHRAFMLPKKHIIVLHILVFGFQSYCFFPTFLYFKMVLLSFSLQNIDFYKFYELLLMILFQPNWGAEGRFLGAFSLFLQVESSATKKGCFRHAMQRQCYLLAKA